MSVGATLLTCYNKGCGKQYDPETNTDDSCSFHPGNPVFHDALKGWSCCNKKSTDFSTFLSYPGCTKGQHSNVKPPEPEKPKEEPNKLKEVIMVQPQRPAEPIERPSADEPLVDLPIIVSPSLITALEANKQNSASIQEANGNKSVAMGTPCKNRGCQNAYDGEESFLKRCLHHPGVPIFHEGMKYWSCCQRKTSDFDNFLNQAGCTEGLHLWFKESNASETTSCRHDFHQTGGFAILTIYSKNPLPNDSIVRANRVKLEANISFENGTKSFSSIFNLYGVINLEASLVTYYQTKVEIKLKKAELYSWKKFESDN